VIAGVVPAGSAHAAGVPPTGAPAAGAAATAQSVCPDALAPPPPEDTSERPLPGQSAPPPVPAPPAPVGGPQMGTCGRLLPPGAPPPPAQVQVASWTLADLDSGAVIAAQAPHDRERPASTIKVLTALLALRELKPTDTIVATQQDADQEGSKVGLEPGQTYAVRQVVTGMLMRSGNDAAHALSARLGGDPVTTQKMTALAHQLGAQDTRIATPAGLDGPGMSTSAYDLAVIFREAMKNPEFAQAVNTPQITLPGKPGQPPEQITNDNQFTGKYPDALGGKPGFTDDARHTFIAAAQRGNRRLEAVLMRGENKPPNHQNEQAMRLLDYGFSLPQGPPVGQLYQQPAPPPAPRSESTRPASASAQDEGGFGAVAAPLGIVVIIAGAVAVVLVQRRRRARAAGEQSDEHP
jgi:D-alanyl-D-alanine carboxypeptidase (penicillin-binding protein 5/6)